MKRVKRQKIKTEKAECSSQHRGLEEHDLAYYIHDRVELMHQVFSMIKYKELKMMAPECVRNLAIGDLEELCTEELLGISSKRLLAILDGAEPPSDTESSSPSPPPDQLETISLDSISSDEELLAASGKKKKHKHRHRGSKSKSKKKDKSKEPETQAEENPELSKASRAGLTVLELLELQARARAIRAQLQQEQANRLLSETTAVESSHHSSDNEVEIKEEPADVVEISSEDEKPDVKQLKKHIADKITSPKATNTVTLEAPEAQHDSQTVTKRINDLIITVPHTKPTRKIKLNRNKVTVSVPNVSDSATNETRTVAVMSKDVSEKLVENIKITPEKLSNENKLKKKRKKKKTVEKDGSDHDEITLQLSDSEKMDLLEDLDESRKNYDKVSSSSEDTESSSTDSDHAENTSITEIVSTSKTVESEEQNTSKDTVVIDSTILPDNDSCSKQKAEITISNNSSSQEFNGSNSTVAGDKINVTHDLQNCHDSHKNSKQNTDDDINKETEKYENTNSAKNKLKDCSENYNNEQTIDKSLVHENTEKFTNQNASASEDLHVDACIDKSTGSNFAEITFAEETKVSKDETSSSESLLNNKEKVIEITSIEEIPLISNLQTNNTAIEFQNDSNKNDELNKKHENELSDGEISDRQSSEIETIDVQPEIVCISDEDGPKNKSDKKKKKKDKKSKKQKKLKKAKLDFHEGSDQNFYRDINTAVDGKNQENNLVLCTNKLPTSNDNKPIDVDSDDVYEILELSDDSSCYEVEGTVLSKEPTADEIEALSAKIDEIERVEVVTEEQIRAHEQMLADKEIGDQTNEKVDTISWKDRYLGSSKVKKVLTTAYIFNALRKKNKELKKKIEDSKKTENINKESNEQVVYKETDFQLEEGSIDQYNTLPGSNKYVDPVKDPVEENKEISYNKEESDKFVTKATDENVTKEMKKDAKQLLKMYKRLLMHNDMSKQKDANKKKKKKQKKKDKQDNGNNIPKN